MSGGLGRSGALTPIGWPRAASDLLNALELGKRAARNPVRLPSARCKIIDLTRGVARDSKETTMANPKKPGEAGRAGERATATPFGQMKLPEMPDVEGLLGAYRRNIEVFTAANRVAMEGAQAVARRHMEIMQQAMAEMSEAMTVLSTAGAPQDRAAKQAELLRRAYERAVNNARELSEMIQRSNGEAVEILNRRFMEAMDEVRTAMERRTPEG